MKALKYFTAALIFVIIYLSTNTFPDIKLINLFGFDFGVNYNDYLLLKLLALSCIIIFVTLEIRKKNGE
jgi:hypothetical protein